MPATSVPVPAEIFKAYDIRGVVGEILTPEIVALIGRALGTEARESGTDALVIGRDGRLSGPELSAALAKGLLETGCDVIDIGLVPTPVVYFAVHELGTGSGIALTGSHNPPDYNGLKMMLGGETLAGERIQALRRRILEQDFTAGDGKLRRMEMTDRYLDRILSDLRLARPLEIVIDCGNGAAGAVAPVLFRRLGCEVTGLFCEVDGAFPNHHPDPSRPENLRDLATAVRETGAEFGLAFDGDGDRLGVVGPDGAILWPDRLLVLFAREVLSREPGAEIIYDVKCSQTVPRAIEEAGGVPVMGRTGHSFMKAALKERGAALAGEMSGHVFFAERWYGFDDGLYAGARLCELLSRDKRAAGEIFAEIPDTVNTPELHLHTAEGEHHELVREMVEKARFEDGRISTIDGLRVDFDDGFGLVRASNTTPTVIFRFEGRNEAALRRIQDRFRALLHSVRPGLKPPS